jgi:hypothetical protein
MRLTRNLRLASKVVCIVGLAAVGVSFASVTRAQGLDGTYTGVLSCDSRGGLKPLKTDLRIVVSGTTATYEREIMVPGRGCPTGCPSGVYERGDGTVTPSGEVALRGKAEGTGSRGSYRFQSEYQGQLSGSASGLRGIQRWVVNGQSEPDRSCQIELPAAKK